MCRLRPSQKWSWVSLCNVSAWVGGFGFALYISMHSNDGNRLEVQEPATNIVALRKLGPSHLQSFMQPVQGLQSPTLRGSHLSSSMQSVQGVSRSINVYSGQHQAVRLSPEQQAFIERKGMRERLSKQYAVTSDSLPIASALPPLSGLSRAMKRRIMDMFQESIAREIRTERFDISPSKSATASVSRLSPEQLAFMEGKVVEKRKIEGEVSAEQRSLMAARMQPERAYDLVPSLAQVSKLPREENNTTLSRRSSESECYNLTFVSALGPRVKLSREQEAFMERKMADKKSCNQQALMTQNIKLESASPLASASLSKLAPEQQAFIENQMIDKKSSEQRTVATSMMEPERSDKLTIARVLGPEQKAFMERKLLDRKIDLLANMMVQHVSPSTPPPKSMSRLAPEQQAFMDRKMAHKKSSEIHTLKAKVMQLVSPSPSPSPPASMAGLTPEQQAFMERKIEGRKSSVLHTLIANMKKLVSRSPAHLAPIPELTSEQQAFMERKLLHKKLSKQYAFTPQSSSSASPRASTPKLTPEQLAFMERKRLHKKLSEQYAVTSHSSSFASPPMSTPKLTSEQQEFMERKMLHKKHSKQYALTPQSSSFATAPTPTPKLTPEQHAFMERKRLQKKVSKQYAVTSQSSLVATPPASASVLTPEQQAFIERKLAGKKASAQRGSAAEVIQPNCSGGLPSVSTPMSNLRLSREQQAFMERKLADKNSTEERASMAKKAHLGRSDRSPSTSTPRAKEMRFERFSNLSSALASSSMSGLPPAQQEVTAAKMHLERSFSLPSASTPASTMDRVGLQRSYNASSATALKELLRGHLQIIAKLSEIIEEH